MNIIGLVGIALVLLAVFGGMSFELHSISFINESALFIVCIGTVGGLVLQSNLELLMNAIKLLKWIFIPPVREHHKFIDLIVDWSSTARRSGLASLEPFLEDLDDPFQAKALQMLIHGMDPIAIQQSLLLEIDAYNRRVENYIKLWESAGIYAVATGTLASLISSWGQSHALQTINMIGLIYGITLSYLIFRPISQRLRELNQEQILLRKMIIDGVVSIGDGENPKMIQSKLTSYLP